MRRTAARAPRGPGRAADSPGPARRIGRLARSRGSCSVLSIAGSSSAHELTDRDALVGHVDELVAPRRQVLADEVRPDRQLPVASVDHDGQLHRARPPVGGERLERCPHRAPGEQDVVDEDHDAAGEVEGQVGDLLGQHRAQPDVVSVERHVDRPERHRGSLDLPRGSPTSRSASGTPPVCSPMTTTSSQPAVALDDLVRDPHEGPAHLVGVHHLRTGNKNAPSRARQPSLSIGHSGSSSSVRASLDPLHVRALYRALDGGAARLRPERSSSASSASGRSRRAARARPGAALPRPGRRRAPGGPQRRRRRPPLAGAGGGEQREPGSHVERRRTPRVASRPIPATRKASTSGTSGSRSMR